MANLLNYLDDERLSFRAKGVMCFLVQRPDVEWVDVPTFGKEGRTAYQTTLNELKKYGYLQRRAVREKGSVIRWETVLQPDIERDV